jgi:hypothetical protein
MFDVVEVWPKGVEVRWRFQFQVEVEIIQPRDKLSTEVYPLSD